MKYLLLFLGEKMKTVKLPGRLAPGIFYGSKAILKNNEVSAVFMEELQKQLAGTQFSFEFTDSKTEDVTKHLEGNTEDSREKKLANACLLFIEEFVDALSKQRTSLDFKNGLSCLILVPELLEVEFSFYEKVNELLDEKEVALNYFIMKTSEYISASKAHAYSVVTDIVLEFSLHQSFLITNSQTFEMGRLKDALIIFSELFKRGEAFEAGYDYSYKAYSEYGLNSKDLRSTFFAYLSDVKSNNRWLSDAYEESKSQHFYDRWKMLLKDIAYPHSYYQYYLYKEKPFDFNQALENYGEMQSAQALGKIQDSHLPFITAALNAVQFGELISFADSNREEIKDELNYKEERNIVKPTLAYETFGKNGKAFYQL